VLVTGQHPRDPVQVEPVPGRHDRAGPHAGRHRVTAADAHPAAGELGRFRDQTVAADLDRAVVESAHEEHRERGEPDAVLTGGEVGRQGHLGHVVRQFAHHAAEGAGEHGHLFEGEGEPRRHDSPLLERAVVALRASDSGQAFCHGFSVRVGALAT
jgi:hypothetical protein